MRNFIFFSPKQYLALQSKILTNRKLALLSQHQTQYFATTQCVSESTGKTFAMINSRYVDNNA
jgi:hypothetical protein